MDGRNRDMPMIRDGFDDSHVVETWYTLAHGASPVAMMRGRAAYWLITLSLASVSVYLGKFLDVAK